MLFCLYGAKAETSEEMDYGDSKPKVLIQYIISSQLVREGSSTIENISIEKHYTEEVSRVGEIQSAQLSYIW